MAWVDTLGLTLALISLTKWKWSWFFLWITFIIEGFAGNFIFYHVVYFFFLLFHKGFYFKSVLAISDWKWLWKGLVYFAEERPLDHFFSFWLFWLQFRFLLLFVEDDLILFGLFLFFSIDLQPYGKWGSLFRREYPSLPNIENSIEPQSAWRERDINGGW